MSYPRYQYDGNLNIKGSFDLPAQEEAKLRLIIGELFNRWASHKGIVPDEGQQQLLAAVLEKNTEGMSSADVYQLVFSDSSADVYARFIIRIYHGTDALAEAERERTIARDIASSTSTDAFSAQVEEAIHNFEHVVIYRHADDQIGNQTTSLAKAILDLLESPPANMTNVVIMANALQRLMEAVIRTYDRFQTPMVLDGEKYFEKLRLRLLPDILIDASDRQVESAGNALIILNEDRSLPSKKTKIKQCDLFDIYEMLNGAKDYSSDWFEINASLVKVSNRTNQFLRFRSGNRSVWVGISKQNFSELKLVLNRGYKLRFKLDDQLVLTSQQYLQKLGFSSSATLSLEKLQEIFHDEGDLVLGTRHSDLHCNNIRWGSDRAKVIDLGSRDTDLLAVSEARLEISIWDTISHSFEIEDEEIWTILKNLQAAHDPNPETLSPQGYILNTLLVALRRGATNGHSKKPTPRQVTLAYVAQCLLYQRYYVEQGKEPARILDLIITHWMSKLQFTQSDEDTLISSEEAHDETFIDETQSTKITLLDLWKEALSSQDQQFLDARAETFLFELSETQKFALDFSLTDFQERVWEAAQDPDRQLFNKNNHVILAAPTSAGKSTVAEMFLLRPYLLNHRRRCAIYIAPTRALTQAKHRELQERFSTDKNLADNILLSTGENTEYDWRINHGQFAIACMVYEKANILFSQNHKLLERLGCVVVDEFHMLADLERGPILEVALTKVIQERRKVDEATSRAPNQETIRIIAISTEGEPDESIQSFLESTDFDTFAEQKPVVVNSSARPVSVQHWFVLPRTEPTEQYHLHSIGYFTPTQNRLLQTEQLQELNKNLYQKFEKSRRITSQSINIRQEMEKRLVQLVTSILKRYPKGHQILVFIPSRSQIEDSLSGALRNALIRAWTEDGSLQKHKELFQRELVKRVESPLETAEDKRMAKLVRTSAELGILIHHSDIEKRVRSEIEQICSAITESAFSRVILATETLSYGVNLAIHDVVLFGTEFYTRSRFRITRQEPLSQCAYHNMVGRAGRLGKLGAEHANVYIIVPQDQNAYSIVKDYYSSIDKADSQIYVSDDKAKQLEQAERADWFGLKQKQTNDSGDHSCDRFHLLEAKDLSYPFVRSILDGLRHLNAIESSGNRSSRANVTVEDLLSFFGKTLYVEQFRRKNPNERSLFRCAVLRVLDSCANKPLDLVSYEGGGGKRSYSITPRGEAVIDTGTEIQTVDPLLGIVDKHRILWEELFGDISFPVELLILCVLVQNEVLRDFIRYTPESKLNHPWPRQQIIHNREHVLEQFVRSLGRFIPREGDEIRKFASALRELTKNWIALPGFRAAYENGETESVLRFFNGIISWIHGEERSKVYDLIEGDNLPEGFRGKMERLSQFTEMLNYKIVFLAKILAPGRSDDVWIQADKERELRLLALRIRMGCVLDAIPLFWPWSSNFSRREAVELMNAGLTPSKLLLSPKLPKPSGYRGMETRLRQLIFDLEKYAREELDELRAEMTVGYEGQAESYREAISRLWDKLSSDFKTGVQHFRSESGPWFSFDASLQNAFAVEPSEENDHEYFELTVRKPQFDEYYRILAKVETSEKGMVWYGQKLTGAYRDDDFRLQERQWIDETVVNIIGVQFRNDWTCTVDGNSWGPFKEVLSLLKNKRYLVIVPLPWFPLEDTMPREVRELLQRRAQSDEYRTMIITPAAFATMATFIMRDLISSEACMTRLMNSFTPGSLYNKIDTKDVLKLADNMPERQVPAVIREKIVEMFEV